jgi:alpha-glucosidase
MNTTLRRGTCLSVLFTILVAAQAFAQGGVIPQANWTLEYVDSEELEAGYFGAANAFDGDSETVWTTQWLGSSSLPPHEMQINLGAEYGITGFRYLPRQDGWSNGNIAQYAFYVSTDGISWGSPVATGTFAGGTGEQQVAFAQTRGRYVRLRALTEVAGRPWAVVAELNVIAGGAPPPPPDPLSGTIIPQSGWRLHYVDSQETGAGNPALAAFDGNRGSMWASEWLAHSPPAPHEIQIDLGASYTITGFRYLPRQDGHTHGSIGQYQFFVSADGVNWGANVASGTFPNSASEKQVNFSAKNGRYVRLRALSEVTGQPWTTVAELNVVTSSVGQPPPPPPPSSTLSAIFTPSADHNSLVLHYVLDVFPVGADVTAANSVASLDLGKPAVVNGACYADITSILGSLSTGAYVATVTAVGNQGSGQSAPSAPFNR